MVGIGCGPRNIGPRDKQSSGGGHSREGHRPSAHSKKGATCSAPSASTTAQGLGAIRCDPDNESGNGGRADSRKLPERPSRAFGEGDEPKWGILRKMVRGGTFSN